MLTEREASPPPVPVKSTYRPKQLRKHTLAMTTKGFKYEVPWDAHTKSLAEVVSGPWRDRAFNSIVWWSPYGKHLGFMGLLQLIIYKH